MTLVFLGDLGFVFFFKLTPTSSWLEFVVFFFACSRKLRLSTQGYQKERRSGVLKQIQVFRGEKSGMIGLVGGLVPLCTVNILGKNTETERCLKRGETGPTSRMWGRGS